MEKEGYRVERLNQIPGKFMSIPLVNLVHAEWNYKETDLNLHEKLKNNLVKNGQIENLVVREISSTNDFETLYEVVNGNHRLTALMELEFADAYCYNLGEVSDNLAKRIAIELNETRFASDTIKLSELLQDISAEFGREDMLSTMPYDEHELEAFISYLDYDINAAKKVIEEEEALAEEEGTEDLIEFTMTFKADDYYWVTQLTNDMNSTRKFGEYLTETECIVEACKELINKLKGEKKLADKEKIEQTKGTKHWRKS